MKQNTFRRQNKTITKVNKSRQHANNCCSSVDGQRVNRKNTYTNKKNERCTNTSKTEPQKSYIETNDTTHNTQKATKRKESLFLQKQQKVILKLIEKIFY